MNVNSYLVPKENILIEHEVKNSRFIVIAQKFESVDSFKTLLIEIKKQYPDARHHCWAYRIGCPNKTTLVSMSDDGEPSGTAGKPMLNILMHSEIGDIGVIVVRYFGGTKLGTGGLVRAYSQSVQMALDTMECELKEPMTDLEFEVGFEVESSIRRSLENHFIKKCEVSYSEKVLFKIEIPLGLLEGLKSEFENLVLGQIIWKAED